MSVYGLENFGLAWLHPVSRLAELDGRATLSNLEKKELLWLRRNRGHETFVYLNKIHAIQRSQEKLSATRDAGVLDRNDLLVEGKTPADPPASTSPDTSESLGRQADSAFVPHDQPSTFQWIRTIQLGSILPFILQPFTDP